jgi:Pyridoxal-dependent decarboxylase conserved domain
MPCNTPCVTSKAPEGAGGWLKDLFGLPQTASFAFVTGAQVADMTCLASARHRLLKRTGSDVEEQGLRGAPAIRIITSSERHGSIDRAIRILGIGKRALVELPCDSNGRLEPATLARALEANPGQPSIVVLQARRTDATIARIVATGEVFFGGTTWRGKCCMRVSVCNWQTSEADVDRAVQAAQHVLGNLAP